MPRSEKVVFRGFRSLFPQPARDRSYLKVSADLPEEDIPVVVRGAPCEIRTSGYCAFTCWKNTSSSEWVWPEMGLSGLTGSVIWLRVSPQAA